MEENLFSKVLGRIACLVSGLLLSACAKDAGSLLPSPLQTQDTLIVISGDTNHSGITRYDLNGNPLGVVTNYRAAGGFLRGAARFDNESFLVSLDTSDRIEKVYLDGTTELFHGSAFLNGNLYGLALGTDSHYYQVESNRIEAVDLDGVRQAAKYVNTVEGGCTLNSPRNLIATGAGKLIVFDIGGTDNIHTYDITGSAPVCDSSVAFGQNPYAGVLHSDGYLYVATQGNDQIYRADPDGSNATVIWSTDTAVINDPTAIVEHPSGDLLVASSATDSVERIQVDGTRVGTDPFIADTYSLNISEMIIQPGVEQ